MPLSRCMNILDIKNLGIRPPRTSVLIPSIKFKIVKSPGYWAPYGLWQANVEMSCCFLGHRGAMK